MPPVLNYPGVYIEELPSGVNTITGVATSIAAFVGWADQGPVDEATLVQSWQDFQTQFGGLDSRSTLGYAVNQFFANGGQQAYIVRIVWDGSLPAAPGTSPTPCATAVAAGLGAANAVITATAGSVSGSSTLTVGTPALQSITVTPANPAPLPIGVTLQFKAAGSYSDGSTQDVTGSAAWNSSSSAVASVSGGLVTANSASTCTITATVGVVSGSVTVSVTPTTVASIKVTPAGPPIGVNLPAHAVQQQLLATATYSNGTTQDITALATWSTSSATDATVSGGLVTGLVASTTPGITAAWAGQSGTLNVSVSTVLLSLAITPANPTVANNASPLQFTATASNSDGSTPNVTGSVTWSSSNTAVATISTGGQATVTGATGSTVITAASGAVSASTTLTVTTATLKAISVSPAAASVASGLTQQLTATGSYSDGSTANLTGSVTWASTPTSGEPTFSNPSAPGLATAKSTGTFSITAAWAGVTSGPMSLTVTAAVPVTVVVSPASVSIASGQTEQFTATVTNSDGSSGASVTWSSSNTSIATVDASGLASAVASGGTLTLFAANPGAWGNNLQVSVAVQSGNTGRFGLQVINGGQVVENFVNLSVSPTDPQYVVTVIDNDSQNVSFINPATNAPIVPTGVPVPTAAPVALSGGADGTALVPASDGNFELMLNADGAGTGGVHLLDRVDIFNLLCVPTETDAPTIQDLQEYCNTQRAFYIVDSPQTATTASLITTGPVGSTPGSLTQQYSINSAYYYPWVQAPDPLFGNRPTLFPPCGFVAGIYAATDASRGVWKAPAGIDAGLTGVSGLQYVLTDAENGSLNVQAINCLRQFRVYGDVVWGARTLQGNDQAGSQWKYIPIRRLALFLESSLYDGTQWVVFEPNDETLWSQIRLNVGTFMQGLFLQGAFQGTTPQQAYFVKCDSENNPQSSIDQGIVNILVGFAPLYPAEFVVIQIQQMAGQAQS